MLTKRCLILVAVIGVAGVIQAQDAAREVTLAEVNNPASPVDGPAAILRAQVLLDRANFSPGEIDGKHGLNFDRAITAFQEVRGLPVTSKLDDETWRALNADNVPALVSYRLVEQDLAGPFVKIPNDMMAKSKLESLVYSSVEEALGERVHMSPGLLRRLNPGASFKAGEDIQVANVILAAEARKAARVVVSKAGFVRALEENGNVLAHYPCSSGSERDPLPIGEWRITGVSRNPPFHYNPKLFWDADPNHSKAKIPPGPNNPVGVVWIDLSKKHFGIHGTPEPSKVGHTQSHGCIRLTNWDAMELAEMVRPGTPAILQE